MQPAASDTIDIVSVATLAEAVAAPAPIGPSVARLAEALLQSDLICITLDEPRAEALGQALADAVPDACVAFCPAPDALPGDAMAASPANIGARHLALHRLAAAKGQRRAMVLGIEAALALVPPFQLVQTAPLRLTAGTSIDADALAETLETLGYFTDDRVDEPGEMARRGAIELYPTTAAAPVRLDIVKDMLTAIRAFDPISQRSNDSLAAIDILPATWGPTGSDWVSPLTHLPRARLTFDPGIEKRHAQLRALAEEIEPGTATARTTMVGEADWTKLLVRATPILLSPGDEGPGERFAEQRRPDRAALRAIAEQLEAGTRVILAGSDRDLRFLTRRLTGQHALPLHVADSWAKALSAPTDRIITLVLRIDRGWTASGLAVIAAADILGSRAGQARAVPTALDPLGGATDYRIGDVVLHEDHGLGILRGLEAIALGDGQQDAIRIEHAKGAQRLIAIEDADRLWRYGSDPDAVTLDSLDGASWARRRGDIDAAIAVTAKALTDFAAARAERRTAPIIATSSRYEKFVGRFPFTPTRDQLRAIEAVRADLASDKPMDRLIVGDVGYGKTEVALRAAAIAAISGRQVALIAPTTVLVRQHLDSFTHRFAGLGIKVAGLSRLSTAGEAKMVKAGLADGSIQMVIGTQAVVAASVVFKDLALVIIDEEQRFGAADKAKLRARAEAGHVLTLTATPIPRTLQTALVGLQDLSVIATPPARRQPIRTTTGAFDADQLRAALLREKSRGGQSFVVVPRIADMAPLAEQLAKLVPDLVVCEAHGKMDAKTVDQAMVAFAQGQGDILLATNIIEAGLDVPRANTMVVMHADRFGLAQLHQLRGRVGRGARRGTILLLIEPGQTMTAATAKRLKTLEALDHLGAGFAISAQDLDQRGAGDLVGEDQAGHVRLIGVDLYQHLLGRALAGARGEAVDRWTPELHLGGDAGLPDEWIAEEEIRLNLYCRLARLGGEAEIDAFADELNDRFGALPAPAERLIALARIRRLACAADIARVDAGPRAIALTPRPGFAGDISSLEVKGQRLLLRGDPGPDPLATVTKLLDQLIPDPGTAT